MVRTTTTKKISLFQRDIKHLFILTAIIFLLAASVNARIAEVNLFSFYLCPDLNPPSISVYNSNDEIISEVCIGDIIFIEIELFDTDEEITSFVFYQDLNSNNEFDPGEESEVVDFDIEDNIGIFQIKSSLTGQISFDILVSGCSRV